MSSFLNSLEDKLRVTEQKIGALPQELDSVVARLERDKLQKLLLRLDQDCDRLYDKSNARRSGGFVLPFILMPDGLNGPLIRPVTDEDLARWRAAYKSEVRVVIGKGKVEVIVPSELAKEYKATVPQVILAAQQQGYITLGWDEYQKLFDEIGSLIGEDEESGAIVGIPVTTIDSTQEVKILPESSLF
jgi:hypothetical protein